MCMAYFIRFFGRSRTQVNESWDTEMDFFSVENIFVFEKSESREWIFIKSSYAEQISVRTPAFFGRSESAAEPFSMENEVIKKIRYFQFKMRRKNAGKIFHFVFPVKFA